MIYYKQIFGGSIWKEKKLKRQQRKLLKEVTSEVY